MSYEGPQGRRTVGVAMCTFNGAEWIERQLRSIMDQTRRPDVIVISDGGSTDGTVELLQKLVQEANGASLESPTVSLLVTPPGDRLDVRANFERALQNTSTDVVFLSDQDDQWLPHKIDVEMTAMTEEVLAVGTDALVVRTANNGKQRSLFETLKADKTELSLLSNRDAVKAILRRNIIAGMTMAVSRKLIDLALPIPECWRHDAWLATLAASLRGLRVIDDRLVRYTIHDRNAVGVEPRTLRFYARRLVRSSPTGVLHMRRYSELVDRLRGHERLDRDAEALIFGKVQFERARANYPRNRAQRGPSVMRQVVAGRYSRFSSEGLANAARDLLTMREA